MKTVIEVKEDGLAYVIDGQERILCADQAQAWTLAEPTGPGIYPIPDLQWEVKEELEYPIDHTSYPPYRQVAILKESTPFHCPSCGKAWDTRKFNACECGATIESTPSTEQESQRSIWRDLFEYLYNDCEIDSNIFTTPEMIDKVKEQFTITRKP